MLHVDLVVFIYLVPLASSCQDFFKICRDFSEMIKLYFCLRVGV